MPITRPNGHWVSNVTTRLILLPGMDGTGDCFAPLLAHFPAAIEVTVIRYDPTTPASYAELERQVRQQLPSKESFVLLGESFSGPIAIAIAASPPKNLIGVIFACSFARNPRPRLTWCQSWIRFLPIKRGPDALMQYFILGSYSTPSLKRLLADAVAQVNEQVLRYRMQQVLNLDYTALLSKVTLPSLYLHSIDDRLVPLQAATYLTSRLPQCKLITIAAPHFLLQVAPIEAAHTIIEFLQYASSSIKPRTEH